MTRRLAYLFSIVLHPLFIISIVLLFLINTNPYLFGFSNEKAKGLIIISVVTISCMFPLISILLMKALGLIETLEMKDKKERIGPLIITGLFYMWLYVNIRNNDLVPDAFSFFVLGCTIAVFIALVINSFTKISLHTISAGGMVAGMIMILYNWSFDALVINIPFTNSMVALSDRLLIMILLVLAGLVGTARLFLKAHKEEEIYGGYLVGIFAQIIAFRIYF